MSTVRQRRLLNAWGASTALFGTLWFAGSAAGETLADALALAYQSNPTLQQARAAQRALDETLVQAKTGWRPTLGITATDDYEKVLQQNGTEANTGGVTLGVTQPLYTSGRTAATVRSAEAGVAAGRENLRATEAQVLQSVVQAYEDVLRDQTILAIREEDVAALRRVLDEVSAKREVGQITRTDVLQIQSQLLTAEANLSQAKAVLQNSRAEYAGAVGQNPGTLLPPPPLPELPKDVTAAFDEAEAESPVLLAAKLTEQSSRERIAEARAGLGPTVSLGAQLGYAGSQTPAQNVDYEKAVTAQVNLSQPLFTGGLVSSQIRQTIQQNEADRLGVDRARREVVQNVAQAWNQVIGSARMERSDRAAYDAAKLELEGMQEEYKAALRSTLEVLSADEALRAAELNLATAEHDGYVAEAALLGAIGRLEAGVLLQNAPRYDPKRNFNKVKNKGATPYEPLIAGLDTLSIGHVFGTPRIEEPAQPAGPPLLAPTSGAPDPDSPMATNSPVLTELGQSPSAANAPRPASRTLTAAAPARAPSEPAPAPAAPPPAAPIYAASAPEPEPSGLRTLPAGEALSAAERAASAQAAPFPPPAGPSRSPSGAAAALSRPPADATNTPPQRPVLLAGAAQSPTARPYESLRGEIGEHGSAKAVDPQTRRSGARGALVQIGAFATPELATAAWRAAVEGAGQNSEARTRVIEPVPAAGGRLYRALVGGFQNGTEASRFCASLRARGEACFVRGG